MAHPLVTKVDEIVKSKPIAIFMKGTPEMPMCGFSNRAVQVLKAAGVADSEIASVNVLEEDDLWTALEDYTQYQLVPQVFVKGTFVGGSDILVKMYERGELQELLKPGA